MPDWLHSPLFLPQPLAALAGLAMAATQLWLVLSGNFAWLNLTTLVLAASAFDDAAFARVLPVGPAPTAAAGWHDALVLAVARWWPRCRGGPPATCSRGGSG